MEKEFTIKVKMKDRWIPHFLGMLKYMQTLGNIGSSRTISFFSDGDGDFRPKFEWDIEVEPFKGGIHIDGKESITDRSYDAG